MSKLSNQSQEEILTLIGLDLPTAEVNVKAGFEYERKEEMLIEPFGTEKTSPYRNKSDNIIVTIQAKIEPRNPLYEFLEEVHISERSDRAMEAARAARAEVEKATAEVLAARAVLEKAQARVDELRKAQKSK